MTDTPTATTAWQVQVTIDAARPHHLANW